MTTARQRSNGTLVSFRSLILPATFALGALLAGCFGDDLSGRILRPPSGGNNTAFSYGSVAVGGTMNCLLTNGGGARCWGQGRLGDGRTTDSDRLVRVSGAVVFAELSVAGPGACGITTNGVAMCWGSNFRGGLGNGSLEPSDIPVQSSTQERFSAIHASGLSACAISVEGAAFCWGANRQGELGIASGDTMALVPEPVVGGLTFTRIALTFGHTCAITQEGAPYCWGLNWGPTPQPVPTTARFTSIDAGGETVCGLTSDGELWCWGSNRAGLFANGQMDDPESNIYHTVPIQAVTDLRFSKLSVGGRHSCAIEIEREEAYCWGADDTGQLGDGTPPSGTDDEFKLSPSRVDLSRRVVDIGARLGTSCAATTEGEAYCWGWRTGNAANPVSDVPVGVG